MLKRMNTNEGFEYQTLSPEEMKAKGILGRLVGPCADFRNPTRNGRKYSEQLWENVFNNPIMQEKINNKCCFGELCHPADRTEVDLEKAAICLAEQPKKGNDGKLYGIFDILDTPCGRILKSLCDYGCNIGISSRGQGDLITDRNGDESVDPDTYECEGFDAVIIPAVESARLKYVTESLDTHSHHADRKSLKQTLRESLENASEEDRQIMRKTLEDLDIDIENVPEDKEEYEKEGAEFAKKIATDMSVEDAAELYYDEYQFNKYSPEDAVEEMICKALEDKLEITHDPLTEAKKKKDKEDEKAEEEEPAEKDEKDAEDKDPEEADAEEEEITLDMADVPLEGEEVEDEPKDVDGVVDDLTTDEEEAVDAYDKAAAEIEAMEVLEKDAVLDIIQHIKEEEQEHIKELEDALAIAKGEKEPEPEEDVDGEKSEESPDEVPAEGDEEMVELKLDDIESPEAPVDECIDASRTDIDEANKGEKIAKDADDVGDDKLLNTLKEALKGKKTLETEIKSLHEKLAVSDAKVNELNEEIERYKKAVSRLASMSKSSKDLSTNVSKLEESLKEKDATIEEQKTRIARLVKSRKESVSEALSLNESVSSKTSELKTLNETLVKTQADNKKLTEELASTKAESEKTIKGLEESVSKATSLKEAYKKLANKAVNKYIDMKAVTLGLTSAEIKRKLGESYTLTDVDQVCEELKVTALNVSRLPFNSDSKVRVRVNESVRKPSMRKPTKEYEDDDVDDTLMKLANLNY